MPAVTVASCFSSLAVTLRQPRPPAAVYCRQRPLVTSCAAASCPLTAGHSRQLPTVASWPLSRAALCTPFRPVLRPLTAASTVIDCARPCLNYALNLRMETKAPNAETQTTRPQETGADDDNWCFRAQQLLWL